MVESSVFDPHENDVERNESIVHRNGRDVARNGSTVDRKKSNVDGSRRDANGTDNVTSDVTHSIFQLATLARKKLAQHFHPCRKLDFTPATLLEKLDSDKGNETDILDDD